jgi:hypothetical protein
MPKPAAVARPLIAATAVAAPLASALAVAWFHTHSTDANRQLDLIKANVAGFTGMIMFEHLTWVCIAVACAATATRIKQRGAWPAAIGAVFAIVGAVGSLGDFGATLPTLSRMGDRSAAVWFVNHLGPIYAVNSVLSAGTLIGLLLMFVGLWRARMIHVAFLGTFLLGAVLLSFTGHFSTIGELAAFALLAVALSQVTRLLLRPADTSDQIVPPSAVPAAHDATHGSPA